MIKPVEFHHEAAAELEAGFDWCFARSRRAAAEFASEVDQAISGITQAPERRSNAMRGNRRCLLRKFPFANVYRELPSIVQIIAVAHGRRRPGYWIARL